MVVMGDEFNLPDASLILKSIVTLTFHEADELLPPEGSLTPDTQQLLIMCENLKGKLVTTSKIGEST
jgi:hypothetical protein